METMGSPNSKAEIEAVLADARTYSFENAESEISDLREKVFAEEVRLLRADLFDLRPQLKYLTDPPDSKSPMQSSYATIIEAGPPLDALVITRNGTLLELDSSTQVYHLGRIIKHISPESAIRVYGLDEIREGLANIFSRKRDDMTRRSLELTRRLERLQKSQAFLKGQ